MNLEGAIARIAKLLDEYAASDAAMMLGVASDEPAGPGVPPEMQVGDVDPEGWVEWRMLASRASLLDIQAIEHEFSVRLPTELKAYLLAREHLFDEVRSNRFDQTILMTATPSGDPLQPLRDLVRAWLPLTCAGYLPFAQWGDGWGPMCLDVKTAQSELDDAPVVWFDHEVVIPLAEDAMAHRPTVSRYAEPLYDGLLEFLNDVFASGKPA